MPTYVFLQFHFQSAVCFVRPLEDSVSEAVCIRQDLACGLEAHEVRKSKSCADSGDEVAIKTAEREPRQVIESTSHRPS